MAKYGPGRMSFLKGWKRNAKLFAKSKIGVIGLVIIVFFVVLAVFAPQIDSNNPVFGYNVAAPYSVPAWAVLLPQYSGLAVTSNPVQTVFASQADLAGWKIGLPGQNFTTGIENGNLLINASIIPNQKIMKDNREGNPDNPQLPGGQVFFTMSKQFQYTQKSAPSQFQLTTYIDPLKMTNVSDIYINFIISNPTKNFSLASTESYVLGTEIDLTTGAIGVPNQVQVLSGYLQTSGLPAFNSGISPSKIIFNGTGTYTLTLQVQAVPVANTTSISMLASGVTLKVLGGAYGVLGTDNYGRDVWSQLVWGSRVSLLIGILSGVGAVALGTLVGLTAGYLGGFWDEILGRITDFFLVIPFLPLLIVFLFIIGNNPALYRNVYTWVIIIFVALSWPYIGRLIRSQVLSVKERPYVEASRAVGGGTWHIIRRHILPNVMGLVYSQIALNVSGFILTEAALDYLAVAIHPVSTMTWGIMLTNALPDATANSVAGYVWWWFLPPGICIAALSLAFVLVGFALDSIFNPRLRAR